MNWIERLPEPERLYLAWQAPDHLGDRFRWAVGVIEKSDDGALLRYLQSDAEFTSLNHGRTLDQLYALGFEGYPAFKIRKLIHTDRVVETLMRRLPPRNRSDFLDFRRQFRISDNVELSDLALLAQTEAKLPSDGFSVVDPLDPETRDCDLMLEVAGVRYNVDPEYQLDKHLGFAVFLVPEPDNPHDRNAIQVIIDGKRIGYINRLQAATFRKWLSTRSVGAVLERVNGSRERPRVFTFVRVRIDQRVAA
jgi:hypothetical protein